MTLPRKLKPATEEFLAKVQDVLDSPGHDPERRWLTWNKPEMQSLLDLITFQRLQLGDMREESGAYAAGVEDGRKIGPDTNGKENVITVESIRLSLSEMDQDDSEDAHYHEDHLHQGVLKAIAEGRCDNPAACAAEALKTLDMDFSRWYA